MEIIDQNHPKYNQVVDDNSEREYTIDSNQIAEGETVICPHDKDMSVSVVAGEVLVTKKAFSKHCFIK